MRREHQTTLVKSPWDIYVILRIICVLRLKFEKSAAFHVKTRCASRSPLNTMLKIRKKLQVVVFNIV